MKIKETTGEEMRIYHYPGGEVLAFENVYELRVGGSGVHYLDYETQGELKKAIVSPGWLWIEIHAEEWP